MDERIDQILRTVEELQKKLIAVTAERGQNNGNVKGDFIHMAEFEKMKADIQTKLEEELKAIRLSSKAPLDNEEIERKARLGGMKTFGELLMTVKDGNRNNILKTSMSEGTDAQGGYTVPQEWDSGILGFLNDNATILPKLTKITQGTLTRNLPKWLTDLTVTWTAEGIAKTTTKPTLESKTSTLKKLAAIVSFTDEYLEDDISDIASLVIRLVGENMAVELERVALTGDVTGLTDPFNGILYATGTNTVNQVGALLAYSDLSATWNNQNVLEKNRVGAEWTMNRAAFGKVMGMVDANGRPLWNIQSINGRMVNTLFGDTINISNTLLNTYTLGGGTNETAIIYGNLRNVIMGQRRGNTGIKTNVTNQGIISSSTSVSINLWQQDETGYRFVRRNSIVVANPEAFSVLLGVV